MHFQVLFGLEVSCIGLSRETPGISYKVPTIFHLLTMFGPYEFIGWHITLGAQYNHILFLLRLAILLDLKM